MKREFQSLFKIRIQSVPVDLPLPFTIYLNVCNEAVLFRKPGDVITGERMKNLLEYQLREVYIPQEERSVYLSSLRHVSKDPDIKREKRGKYLKELAFTHVQDLFQKPELEGLVTESEALVEDMVDFISEDVEATAALMKLSTHDYYTYNHCVNVAVYSIAIAKKILGNDKSILIKVGMGGLLHDIGKRMISTSIITKPGRLTPEEWGEIKRHPDYGIELINNFSTIPSETRQIIHEHHENVDGSGYPRGVQQEEISLVARISSIADVFDALTTNRSYKNAVAPQEALQIMYTMQPGKFDNSLFTNFDKGLNKKTDITIEKDFDPCDARSRTKKVA